MDAISGMIELVKLVKNNWFIKEEVETLERKVRRLTSYRADVQSKLERVELSSNKKRKYAVENWLADVETMENKVRQLEAEMRESKFGWNVQWQSRVGNLIKEVDELNSITFGGELVSESCESERVPYTVSRLVGRAFQVNKTKIWEWVMSDEVLSLGIYGMGGIGKTALMMHIYNQFLKEKPSKFNHIYWVTVSQDLNIYKIQDQIAKEIGFDLCGEDDEKKRAARLREALKKRRRSVLILDDMWNQFDMDEIGVPINSSACKLIVTTRSLDICRRMSCQQMMILEPLLEEESWCLFTEKLGNYATLSLEVKQVAKLVADECAGLPLGLVALAGSMRGVDDIREWRSVLEQLRGSRIGPPEMEHKVFKLLNLSFDRLRDPELQECLLYCSVFPEDYRIQRARLIVYLINDEIIKGPTSRRAQIDRVHTMLNKLENACLLQGVHNEDSESYVKMHDLIRDMAIRKSPEAMMEAGKQLRELPLASRWPRDLRRASFIDNHIEHVTGDYSPICPELSYMSLSGNAVLRDIDDCFFAHMSGLRILDLSWTSISVLPNSVTKLPSLTTLLLYSCNELRYIPSLAALKALRELDLTGCGELEEVPAGLEFLSNLRYLDLSETSITFLPVGLFSHYLYNLEYLSLPDCSSLNERLACCGKLDYLSCRVQSPREFFEMAQRLSPSNYTLKIGEDDDYTYVLDNRPDWKKVVLFRECDIGERGELIAVPSTGFDIMRINFCLTLRSLDNFNCFDDGGRVGEVELIDCHNLDYVISLSCLPVPSNIVNHVVDLTLTRLSNLRRLIYRGQPLPSSDVFSCLRVLVIYNCPRIQSLFPLLLTNLQNLEEIRVDDCESMEEIIEGTDNPSLLTGEASNSGRRNGNESAEFVSLPKLRVFELWNLPQLQSICSKRMSCGSLEKLILRGCPRIERIPFSLVQLDNGRLSPFPSLKEIRIDRHEQEWWDSVEFDSQLPDTKYVLEPLITKLSY